MKLWLGETEKAAKVYVVHSGTVGFIPRRSGDEAHGSCDHQRQPLHFIHLRPSPSLWGSILHRIYHHHQSLLPLVPILCFREAHLSHTHLSPVSPSPDEVLTYFLSPSGGNCSAFESRGSPWCRSWPSFAPPSVLVLCFTFCQWLLLESHNTLPHLVLLRHCPPCEACCVFQSVFSAFHHRWISQRPICVL